MGVRYNNGIWALFGFDGSISQADINVFGGNFFNILYGIIMHPSPPPSSERKCDWTMQLLCIQVPLHLVETLLEILGVETITSEDE